VGIRRDLLEAGRIKRGGWVNSWEDPQWKRLDGATGLWPSATTDVRLHSRAISAWEQRVSMTRLGEASGVNFISLQKGEPAAQTASAPLLNRFDTDWRWLLNRDDSPWYPTLRQFRQPTFGDWSSVICAARDALQRLAAGDRDLLRPRQVRYRWTLTGGGCSTSSSREGSRRHVEGDRTATVDGQPLSTGPYKPNPQAIETGKAAPPIRGER
jgi:hypothetical protein